MGSQSLGHPESADLFGLLCGISWIFGICWIVSSLSWRIDGVDQLQVTPSGMGLTRSVAGVVFKRRLSSATEVRNLRYSPESWTGRYRSPACICYEDSRGTVKFGPDLSETEARTVIEQLLSVYPFPVEDQALEYTNSSG